MITELVITATLVIGNGCSDYGYEPFGNRSCVPAEADVAYVNKNAFYLDIEHEAFHIIDHHIDDGWRLRWQVIMGDPRPWIGENETNPPFEQAAEGYKACKMRLTYRRQRGKMAYNFKPTRGQYRSLCQLYRELPTVRWQE